MKSILTALFALASVVGLGVNAAAAADPASPAWQQVVPGVFRSEGFPYAYALVADRSALLVGASAGANLPALKQRGVDRCELVLLTHHLRDSCAQAADFIAAGIPVRAAKKTEPLLAPDGVRL